MKISGNLTLVSIISKMNTSKIQVLKKGAGIITLTESHPNEGILDDELKMDKWTISRCH